MSYIQMINENKKTTFTHSFSSKLIEDLCFLVCENFFYKLNIKLKFHYIIFQFNNRYYKIGLMSKNKINGL